MMLLVAPYDDFERDRELTQREIDLAEAERRSAELLRRRELNRTAAYKLIAPLPEDFAVGL